MFLIYPTSTQPSSSVKAIYNLYVNSKHYDPSPLKVVTTNISDLHTALKSCSQDMHKTSFLWEMNSVDLYWNTSCTPTKLSPPKAPGNSETL